MGVKENDNSVNEETKCEEKKEKEEKEEARKEEIGEVEKEEKPNVFVRVKERLSKRSKKQKKEVKPIDQNEENLNENGLAEREVKKECKSDMNTATTSELEENEGTSLSQQEKQENFFKRLFKRFSSRSKKKKETNDATKNNDINDIERDAKQVKNMKQDDDIKSLSSVDEDLEISALCKDDTEEPAETSPSVPIMSSNRPPLPSMRRPPSSATTAQSRPVSQLDAALKQFKLSTAASRENLRGSRVDISQVEERVKTMVTSRPSTPTPAGWRSRAPAENTNLSAQWAQLSSSMTDLR